MQIDDDARSFGAYVPVNQPVHGDADTVVRAMTATLLEAGHTPNRAWLDRITAELARREPEQDFVDRSGTDTVDPRTASIRLNDVLPARRNLVSDIGRFVHAAWPYISTPDPVGFTAMGVFGSVGLGLTGAIGMAVARPDEPTVCVIGDGGLMMNPAELATAVREQLPLIVVVYDDQCYGFECHKMIGFGATPEHSLLPWPELSGVAQALGADSITIRKVEEFEMIPALSENLDRPFVIVVKLDPTVNIVP